MPYIDEEVGKRTRPKVKEVKYLADRVVKILDKVNAKYVILKYPIKYRERSIDIVAIGDKGNVIIRIKPTARSSKEEVGDLIRASMALDAVPLVVTDDAEIYDNIVYERDNVFVLNERTLENLLLRPNELIVLYRRGDLYVKLRKERLKEIRISRDISLSEASYLTGMSRKALYNYEREGGLVTVETAERLLTAFGEEVIEPVSIGTIKSEFRRKREVVAEGEECQIRRFVDLSKAELYKIRKSAPDYLLKESEVGRVDALIEALSPRVSLRDVIRKITESIKLADLTEGEVEVFASERLYGTLKDELSTLNIKSSRYEIVKLGN